MFGIDQQVQQRIDAYRGNPQKLQQQYAQKKDIFDLIALNRITEEQESAANQMRLDAAKKGTPPSIYAQKESQAVDNAKKEVIDEQAGVMQNKMRQMQEAQKKLLQSAGAPPMPGQATPQPQQPPSAGLAGLPAPNIQGMAGGGIVAFDQGGSTGEEEARRVMEERRQRQTAPQPVQQAAPQGGMQAGLARLLGIDPEAIYQRRNKEAAEAANFNAVERAGYARQADEKKALFDQNRANRALIGMAGYSTPALAIAAGGGQAINDEDRFMRERQSDERKLIDIGPAARMAGMKAGETAYGHGMTGLTSGVDAAARMAATGEMAAGRADATAARLAEMGEKRRADVLTRVEALVTNDPHYKSIVAAMEMPERIAAMEPTPKNIAARDRLRTEKSTVYNQLFQDKLRHHLSDAGNAGTPPPAAGPAPIDWNSMPPRRP